MRAPRTHLILLLDGSGSMQPAYDNMSKGADQILASLQGFENLTLDIWQFECRTWRHVNNQPIEKVPNVYIDWKGGSTSLNAGLEHSIDAKLRDGLEMEEAVLLLMISDGENGGGVDGYEGSEASVLKERIELLCDSGQWTFTVFAASFGRARAASYFAEYGLEHDLHDYQPGNEGAMWDLIERQLGDYMHARQGGTIPDHLKE